MNGSRTDDSWNWLVRTLRSTRWSLVRRVRPGTDRAARLPADEFCRTYWYPLYAWLRHQGYPMEEAQDHVQSFFVWLLRERLLEKADPDKGKLRHFLLKLLTRHVSARREKERAIKRGGAAVRVPLEASGAEVEAAFLRDRRFAVSPEDGFRRALAGQLVAEGVAALRKRYTANGQAELCEILLPALEGPLPESTYEEAARGLNMRPSALRMASLRMRERFRAEVRTAAARALGIPPGPALDEELRELFAFSPPPGV